MHHAIEVVRRTGTASFWAEVAPDLHLPGASAREARRAERDEGERLWLAREGLVTLPGVVAPATAEAISRAILRLVALGLPGTFVYVVDEVWEASEALRLRLEALVGAPLMTLDDFWAFAVAPGTRGWPPHRGNRWQVLDRASPEHLDAWIATTDVPAERGALAFVPLDDDPGYPSDLARVDAPLHAVRALPVAVGTALAWNANVLHWGGPCAARAAGPRVSITFTFARSGSAEALGFAPADGASASLEVRRAAIARQIARYGEGQPDVSAEVLTWARADAMLAEKLGRGVRKEG